MFHKKNYVENIIIKELDHNIIITEIIELDNVFYNINLVYENEPIKLRRLDIKDNNEKTQMGFFNHSIKQNFEKKFFSMIDPYLN